LEDTAYSGRQVGNEVQQLDLFVGKECHPVVRLLEEIKADELSPKQALDMLYQLQSLL